VIFLDIQWGSKEALKFVTNAGIITSNGPHGKNAMTAEWTHQVSYSPGLMAVSIMPGKATYENIVATKEFGINIASVKQNIAASVAGGSTGKEVDKIGALEKLGFESYAGKKINVPMLKGAALNVELKLVNEIPLGSHTLFVGEVVEVNADSEEPLAYHGGKFWKLTEQIEKPTPEQMEKISATVQQYKK